MSGEKSAIQAAVDAVLTEFRAQIRAQTEEQIKDAFENFGLELWAESTCVKCGNPIGAHLVGPGKWPECPQASGCPTPVRGNLRRELDEEKRQHAALREEYEKACAQIVEHARELAELRDALNRVQTNLDCIRVIFAADPQALKAIKRATKP